MGIALLLSVFENHPLLLGMAFLAYTFGLRHAFDVDHIAAIDNTVRKLIQQQADSTGVGFFFSLGHSTVVVCMSAVTVIAAHFAQHRLPFLESAGGIIGTLVSGVFLLIIGCINLVIFLGIYRLFRSARKKEVPESEMEELLLSRGFIARFAKPLFKLVTKSWHIYPIGFLFGLGFDTASEVALLAISAVAAQSTIPFWGILSLPVLFAAGMSLMDTADGVFMSTAYQWAFSTPLRKIYYNLSVTVLGVLAAFLIGLVELAQVLTTELGLHNAFWTWIQGISLGGFGYVLVLLFVLVWSVSFGLWKVLRLEERWSHAS